MKKFTLLSAFIILAVIINAQTSKITIQVNMDHIKNLHRGGDVWVYMDSNWNEYYSMTPDDGDSIYSYTIEKEVGSTLTYSFSYQTGPNPDNDYVVETVPAECANDNGFRELIVPSEDVTLKAVVYGSCYESGVTLRVNLKDVTNLYEGGAVWVYMDENWNEYYTMTDENGDGIYAYTLSKDPGSVLEYSFSYQTGENPDNDYLVETVPGECAAASGFRAVTIPVGDTILPAFSFGSCDEAAPPMVKITFQVDMSNTEVINNDVQVVIKNPWIWTVLTDNGNGIWSGTVEVNPNRTYPYTFVNGGQDNWSGEERVPAGCNFGTETAPERHVTVAESDTTLVLTEFGQCPTEVPTSKVTLQVNMSKVNDLFEGGDVWVYMDADWNEYYTMVPDANDSIYSFTVEKGVGTKLTYSFSYQTGADPDNDYVVETVSGDCANDNGFREITVPSTDVSLRAVSYGSCYEAGITLRVSLNNINDLYEGGEVWVYMDSDWNEYYTMADEDGDGVYTYTLSRDPGSTLYYAFSYQNGENPNNDYVTEIVPDECSAENGFRELVVFENDTVLPAFAFGSCDDSAPNSVKITFQVDMSDTDVINNDVQVVIKNPWIWTALTDQGNGLWTGTVEVNGNATYPYTFVNGGQDNWSGEERVPADCNFGTESAPERHVSVGGNDTTLTLVSFGACAPTVSSRTIRTEDITLYPNPANEFIYINNPGMIIHEIRVIDLTGRTFIVRRNISETTVRIETEQLSKGIYSVIVRGDNHYSTHKIVVNH